MLRHVKNKIVTRETKGSLLVSTTSHSGSGASVSGFTLVETLVAVTILLLVIVGPMTIASRGMQNAYFAGDQTTAIYLAQEAIEHVQSLRDDVALESFDDYKDGTNDVTGDTFSWYGSIPSSCRNQGCDIDFENTEYVNCATDSSACRLNLQNNTTDHVYGYGAGTESLYTRRINIGSPDSMGGVPVTVTVEWNATLFGGTARDVVLQTYVYDHYARFEM
jgi:type II secretory pathway pseudopilin PulG